MIAVRFEQSAHHDSVGYVSAGQRLFVVRSGVEPPTFGFFSEHDNRFLTWEYYMSSPWACTRQPRQVKVAQSDEPAHEAGPRRTRRHLPLHPGRGDLRAGYRLVIDGHFRKYSALGTSFSPGWSPIGHVM